MVEIDNTHDETAHSSTVESECESNARGNATIEDYRLIKTIGKGHYSK